MGFHVQFGTSNFFVSCTYGHPVAEFRDEVWERITRIGIQRTEKWCMIGDFNEILNHEEKLGGPRISEDSFQGFSDMIKACGMIKLLSIGNGFTWG